MLHRCLRGHAAGPEYGDLSLIEIHCIAVIRLHDVPDPNLRPISHMDRSTMDIGHLFCDRIRLLGILRRHGPHGADHGAFKGAGLHSLYIRLIHGHVPALGNVAYLDPSLHQRLLKGKGAADEKARISLFPVCRRVCKLFCEDSVFIDPVPGDICNDIGSLSHIMGLRRSPDDLQNGACKRIPSGKFFKICRILRRQDHQVRLGIPSAHAGGGKIDHALPDQFPHLCRCLIHIRCNIKSHLFLLYRNCSISRLSSTRNSVPLTTTR